MKNTLKNNFPFLYNFLFKIKKKIYILYSRKKLFLSCDPVSSIYGMDRGTPIDRFYIQNFIELNSNNIFGKILEVGNDQYSKKFGQKNSQVDVITKGFDENIRVTLDKDTNYFLGDFETKENLKENFYNCIILTQVLQCIPNLRVAIKNIFTALKSDGTCLITLPGINQSSNYDVDRWGDYWRFTMQSAKKIFDGIKEDIKDIEIVSHGNVSIVTSFLYGLCLEEINKKDLHYNDLNYPIIFTIKIKKK